MISRDDLPYWALIGLVIVALFMVAMAKAARGAVDTAAPSRAADEAQIRSDCRYDALRYCKAAILTADRDKIITCMVANRDRLRPRCAAHIY